MTTCWIIQVGVVEGCGLAMSHCLCDCRGGVWSLLSLLSETDTTAGHQMGGAGHCPGCIHGSGECVVSQ